MPCIPPQFDESPFIVIWEATRACDLACTHCRAEAMPEPHAEQLTDDEVRGLIDHVRGEFGKVLFVITGGDPLKRPGLTELIRYGDRAGLRMAITPSATPLLTPEAIAELRDAGIKRIAISLDGADAATHDAFRGFPGTYERTLRALEAARDLGLEAQINTSVGEANRDQLPQIADLCRWYEISLWSVFILVPTGRATEDLLMTAKQHEQVYRQLAELATQPDLPFDIKTTAGQPFYRVRQNVFKQAGLDPHARRGLRAPGGVNDGKGFVFVDHIGQVQPSGFLPINCGSIRERSLAAIYRFDPTFVRLRRPESFEGKCSWCEFHHACGGSRSRTYALTGDPFASDPTCVYHPKQVASMME